MTKELKKEQLAVDLEKYKVDICGLQETKIKKGVDENVGNYRLISIQSNSEHYGNGFMISKEMSQNIYKYWKVSDRISVLQITTDEEYTSYTAKKIDDLKMKIQKQPIYKSITSEDNKLKIKLKKVKPKSIIDDIV